MVLNHSKKFSLAKQQPASSISSLVRILILAFAQASHALAIPVTQYLGLEVEDATGSEDKSNLWLYLIIAAILVLLGGAFAGLTIALMGQDGVYLQVIATSDEGKQQRHAESVFNLLQKGKHWVLVTLLLSNVIVNETLPIVLDRSLGGGWPAVLGSTVLIVIFGEVIPQSVCVRYGLSIGAYMAPCVLTLMWILAPIAWPIAKLLDIMLGKDHGTVYKKSGLKTLVTLHKTLGASPTERLNQDEVTIISAVLDLKDKAVGDIMTPIDNVFTMSEDTILNEDTMNKILSAGYSRIPIYEPQNPTNFVGMLLVKILITYDPEDCKRVSEFALATLPETRPETSCLDIVNFFQEGKSHMVLVSEYPAENYGAIGVVTLEDVIEELIGEEIIDESDVYIDVHKSIRRLAPAPKACAQNRHVVANSDHKNDVPETNLIDLEESNKNISTSLPNGTILNETSIASAHGENDTKIASLRRSSGGVEGTNSTTLRGTPETREHLKHLGPSNLASCPKSTRYSTVKIKSAHSQARTNSKVEISSLTNPSIGPTYIVSVEEPISCPPKLNPDSTSLIDYQTSAARNCALTCSNPIQSSANGGYGSFDSLILPYESTTTLAKIVEKNLTNSNIMTFKPSHSRSTSARTSDKSSVGSEIIASKSRGASPARSFRRRKRTAQSGSITQNIIEAGGIQKLVLETNSSGDDIDQIKRPTSVKGCINGSVDGNEFESSQNGDEITP